MINESNFNSNIDLTPYKAPICASWDSMALQQSQANCNGTDVPSYVRQVFEIGKNLENSYQSINASEIERGKIWHVWVKEELPISRLTANILKNIYNCECMRHFWEYLPANWKVIGQLSFLDIETIKICVALGAIHPKMQSADVDLIRPLNKAIIENEVLHNECTNITYIISLYLRHPSERWIFEKNIHHMDQIDFDSEELQLVQCYISEYMDEDCNPFENQNKKLKDVQNRWIKNYGIS